MDGMEQQIAPSASAQASSGAIKAASGQGKSAAKGMFAALLSMIEGKGKPANSKGSEKLFEQLTAQGDAKLPANLKVKTAKEAATEAVATAAEPTIQIDSQRKPGLQMKGSDLKLHAEAEPTQNREKGVAVSTADTRGLKSGKHGAATALAGALSNEVASGAAEDATKANSGNHPAKASGASKETGSAFTAGTDRPANAKAKAPATPTVETDSDGSKVAMPSGQATQPHHAATIATEDKRATQSTKAKMATTPPTHNVTAKADEAETMAKTAQGPATHEIGQASSRDGSMPTAQMDDAPDLPAKSALNTANATKGAATVSGKPTAEMAHPMTTARSEEAAPFAGPRERSQATARQSAQPATELKTEQKQPVSIAMQSDKSTAAHSEVSLAGNLPELQRFSTNHFVKNRKINLESLSRSKTASAMAGGEKKPEAIANSSKHIFIPQGETSMPVNKEAAMPAEAFLRSGQPAADNLGSAQSFQIAGAEAASTRAASQPTQTTPHISGPWSVAAAMQQIGHAAAQGKFQLELTLNPEHLGKIQVFLESDASKQIQVHLIVDQPASRQPIEQHLPMLRQALAEQGLSMENFSMASSGEGNKNPQQQEQQHLPAGTTVAENTPHISERPVPAPADSRLSIRV